METIPLCPACGDDRTVIRLQQFVILSGNPNMGLVVLYAADMKMFPDELSAQVRQYGDLLRMPEKPVPNLQARMLAGLGLAGMADPGYKLEMEQWSRAEAFHRVAWVCVSGHPREGSEPGGVIVFYVDHGETTVMSPREFAEHINSIIQG